MPAVGGSAGPYGRLIVTPDMEPPDATHWDTQEQAYRAGAASWDGIHQQIVTDSAEFRDAADSQGFDEVHRVNAVLAEEAKTIAEWHDKCANKCADVATVLRDTRAGQEQLVREADAKIASAKLPGEAEALVTQYHGIARYQTEAGVTAAMASHTAFKASTENARALDLLTRWGEAPTAPPVQPVDHTSPGIEQDENPYRYTEKREAEADAPKPVDDAPADPAGRSTTQPGVSPGSKSVAGDEGIKAATGPVTQPTPGVTSSPATSALGGGGMPSMGGVGGVGGMGGMGGMGEGSGMGGGGPKMSSGGMPAGMGSNPLGGGVGHMPGAASGLPNSGAVSGAGSAPPLSSAFNQGMATTAGMGGGIPSAPPPAPASPSPALSAGGGHAAPPVSAAPGGGVSPAAAQPGMVSPAAPAAAAPTGAGTGGGTPMMLPPGSMGPPAGAPTPAPTVPAGFLSSANAPAAPAPSAASAAAGPTLIPASVVAAGQTAAARERRESADAAAAKELVWKLQHAAYRARNPAAGWAVGVFRSPSGTETVITSNDGSSYIPAGVFVPRSVRVLSTDPLLDDNFRQKWFGWGDPARVLVEYAQLRAQWGWKLVAAATTAGVNVLRESG